MYSAHTEHTGKHTERYSDIEGTHMARYVVFLGVEARSSKIRTSRDYLVANGIRQYACFPAHRIVFPVSGVHVAVAECLCACAVSTIKQPAAYEHVAVRVGALPTPGKCGIILQYSEGIRLY